MTSTDVETIFISCIFSLLTYVFFVLNGNLDLKKLFTANINKFIESN